MRSFQCLQLVLSFEAVSVEAMLLHRHIRIASHGLALCCERDIITRVVLLGEKILSRVVLIDGESDI